MSSLNFDPLGYQSFINKLSEIRYYRGQELEIRFGTFKSKDDSKFPNFFPGVSATDFNRLLDNLKESGSYIYQGVENRKVTYYNDSYRLIELVDENDVVKSQKLEEKKRIKFADLRGLSPYSLRFALSSEKQKSLSLLPSLVEESVKTQKRYMYISKDNTHAIHLTLVKRDTELSYDVEIESVGDFLLKESNYIPVLKRVYKLLTNKFAITSSKLQYDFNKKQGEIVENLNKIDNNLRYERQNYTIDNKPIAVYYDNAHKLHSGYVVSNKLDGVYYNIIISKHGVALVNTSEVQIIFKEDQRERLYQDANLEDNTILVGELYNGSIYVFDVILVDGEEVFNKKYTERLSHLLLPSIYKEFTKISNIPIKNKIIKYSDDVINDIKQVIEESPKYYNISGSFESFNDGIIFTKEDGSYYDETYKWKFPNRISIDGKIKLVSESGNKKVFDIYFKKTKDSLTKLSTQDQLITSLPMFKDGMIVELGWDNGFVPERIREDKVLPNAILTAENTFIQIKNPMNLEQLFQVIKNGPPLEQEISINQAQVKNERFRRFCNLIKSYLINTYCKEGKNVLDLGAGKGGDLYKYEKRKLNKLYLVEPYLYEGLLERLGNLNNQNYKESITTINATAEDTNTIKAVIDDTNIDVINMMFSMTFFGEDDRFNKLRNTLNILSNNGVFVTTYMDGDRTLEKLRKNNGLFEGSFFRMQDINALQLSKNSKNYKLGFGHKINVAIEGESITSKGQDEFLLPSTVINNKLKLNGLSFTTSLFFDKVDVLSHKENREIKEAISLYNDMSEEEKELVSLFRFDVYNKTLYNKTQQESIEVKNTLSSLTPKKREQLTLTFSNEDEKFYRVGAIGDGSCFFHAALQAIVFREYYSLDEQTNKELVQFMRGSIYDFFTKSDWVSIQNGDIAVYMIEEELSKKLSEEDYSRYLEVRKQINTQNNYFVNTYKAIKSLNFPINVEELVTRCFEKYRKSLRDDWIRAEHLEYLSKLFEINFFIVRDITRDVYAGSGVEYNPNNDSIIILNLEGKYGKSSPHYETIVRMSSGSMSSLFNNNDEIVHRLLKRLEQSKEVVQIEEIKDEEVEEDEKEEVEKKVEQRLQDNLRRIVKKHFMSKNNIDLKFELVEYKKKDLTLISLSAEEQEEAYYRQQYMDSLRKEVEEYNKEVEKEDVEIPTYIYVSDKKRYIQNYKNIRKEYGLTKDDMSLLERNIEKFDEFPIEKQELYINTILEKKDVSKDSKDSNTNVKLKNKLLGLPKNPIIQPRVNYSDEWYNSYTPSSNLESIFRWNLHKYFGFKDFEYENFFNASNGYLQKVLELTDKNCYQLFEEFAIGCYVGNIRTLDDIILPEFMKLFLDATLEIYAINMQKEMGLDAMSIQAIQWFNYFDVNRYNIVTKWERLVSGWYYNKSSEDIEYDVADLEKEIDTDRYYSEIQPESKIKTDRYKYPEERRKLYSIFSQFRKCGEENNVNNSRKISRKNIEKIQKDEKELEKQRRKNIDTIVKKYNLNKAEEHLISRFLIDNYHILDNNERQFHIKDIEEYRKKYKKIKENFKLTDAQMKEIPYNWIRFYDLTNKDNYIDNKIQEMFELI